MGLARGIIIGCLLQLIVLAIVLVVIFTALR